MKPVPPGSKFSALFTVPPDQAGSETTCDFNQEEDRNRTFTTMSGTFKRCLIMAGNAQWP